MRQVNYSESFDSTRGQITSRAAEQRGESTKTMKTEKAGEVFLMGSRRTAHDALTISPRRLLIREIIRDYNSAYSSNEARKNRRLLNDACQE